VFLLGHGLAVEEQPRLREVVVEGRTAAADLRRFDLFGKDWKPPLSPSTRYSAPLPSVLGSYAT
jgi:hypothetical protein